MSRGVAALTKPDLQLASPIPALTSDALAAGQIIREPVGSEPGYWVGAPGVFFDPEEKFWYVTYRIRRPRGVEPDRGGEARIARSKDLIRWEDIWSVTKHAFNTASIERCALRKGPDGQWRYLISYVDPADGRWCVSVLNAGTVSDLDSRKVKPVFTAKPLGLEGIKDPWIFEHEGKFYMFLSVAVPTTKTTKQSHSTLDIYNTGECLSATGLAVSEDLDDWKWLGVIFAPGPQGWDCYCRRINSVVPVGNKLLAFYDGSASHAENYEEKTGLALGSLESLSDASHPWKSLTVDNPYLTSPHTSKSLRYVDAQIQADQVVLFYEFARPDGAHDLRVTRTPIQALERIVTSETRDSLVPSYLNISAAELGKGQPVRVRVNGDAAALARDLAEAMIAEIKRGKATLIVPVGPVDHYSLLADMLNEQQISCRDTMFINMDEYLTDGDEWIDYNHPLSFRRYMDEGFYNLLNPKLAPLKENRVFPNPRDPDAIVRLIVQRGGVDACFGGIGVNGHLAFNEPPELGEEVSIEQFSALPTRVLNLSRETRTINSVTVGGEISLIPARAITVGMKEILGSRRLRFYCNRHWQSGVIRRALHGPLTPACPASFLRTHPDAVVTMAEYVAAAPQIRLR